jgi:putative heme-binding domain-containing protein
MSWRNTGQLVFEKTCSACHSWNGKGHAVGPDLASAASRDPQALLAHILDPNQYVLPEYVQYVAADRQGRVFTGLISAQTATSITLKREKNATDTILRVDLEELTTTSKSLMPEGLENDISVQDMADLLAWLAKTPAVPASNPNRERDFGTLPGLIELTPK